ncbi:Ribonuclease H1, partial [Coemansia furcata]
MPRAASLSQAASDGSYYAVRVGRQAGIYRTWNECKANVHAFPGAVFKKFNSLPEAQTFAGPQASIVPAAPVAQAAAPGRAHRTVPYTLDNSRSARNTDKHVRSDARRKAGDGKTGRVGRVNRVSESVTHPQTPPPLVGETADRIVVYTDGASSNNGKKGARAGVGV